MYKAAWHHRGRPRSRCQDRDRRERCRVHGSGRQCSEFLIFERKACRHHQPFPTSTSRGCAARFARSTRRSRETPPKASTFIPVVHSHECSATRRHGFSTFQSPPLLLSRERAIHLQLDAFRPESAWWTSAAEAESIRSSLRG